MKPSPDDWSEKVRGAARYISDLSLPDMAHAKLLRSPHPHARVVSIDTRAAEALPGVYAVVTRDDLAGLDAFYGEVVRDQPLLAMDKVRHVGDVVAAVAAVDERTAYRAIERIEVLYDLLPPVPTVEAALAPGAPALFEQPASQNAGVFDPRCGGVREPHPNVLYEFDLAQGDLAKSLASCDHVFEDEFRFSRMIHYHLEPLVTIARVENGRIELWSNNQDPFVVRENIATIFRIPASDVVLHIGLIGGGFGGKSHCKTEPLTALIARKARRPVRLAITMDEAMLSLSQHGALIRLTTGVAANGRLMARDCRAWLDGGAYADAGVYVAAQMGYCFPGPYRWQALRMSVAAVRTSTVPAGSFRGFGRVQSTWASESQIDMIARRLGLDPYEMRRRNLLARGDTYLVGDTPIDCDLIGGLDAVADGIRYTESVGRNRGKGLAIGFKSAGGHARKSEARVSHNGDGSFVVEMASSDIGQGARQVARRVVAEVLGVEVERVDALEIDTSTTPYDAGTHACTGVALTAKAVENAARELLVLMKNAADGECCSALGTQQQTFDPTARPGSRNLYWQPAWAAAEVETDPDTGKLTVHKLVVAADAGRAINLVACHGQLLGGAIQGLGQALFEQLKFTDGRPGNASPRQYRVPLASDLPKLFETILLEDGTGPGPFGAKGIGESTIMPIAAAIANAIDNAVGVRLTALPLTASDISAAQAKPAAAAPLPLPA